MTLSFVDEVALLSAMNSSLSLLLHRFYDRNLLDFFLAVSIVSNKADACGNRP